MFTPKPGRSYSKEQLEEAIKTSDSYVDIIRKLGLPKGSCSYNRVERDALLHGLDISHIPRNRKYQKYNIEMLKNAVSKSHNMREVMDRLAFFVRPIIILDILRSNIDISHFDGREHYGNRKNQFYKRPSLEDIFSNKAKITTNALRIRLIKEGIKKYRCEVCHRSEYLSEPISLELNHINGNENDNNLENLQMICSNCHSQTPTFAGRNKMLKFSDADILYAIKNSRTMTESLYALGGNRAKKQPYRLRMKEDVARLGVDISHWITRPNYRKQTKYVTSIDEILKIGSSYKTDNLRRRLIKEGIKEARCECCGITEWNDKPLSFTLDHKNGIKNDHRIENLRILCFICHARTPNYKGKNIGVLNKGKSKQYHKRRKSLTREIAES